MAQDSFREVGPPTPLPPANSEAGWCLHPKQSITPVHKSCGGFAQNFAFL
jgi:hypothetical protein